MSLPPPPPIFILLFTVILFAIAPPTTLAKFKDVSARPKCANASFAINADKGPSASALAALRKKMRDIGLDAYIIPAVDQHDSEYIGPTDMRRQWVTKFTGSAGTAIVTPTKAILWTDGRYWLQAEDELDCNWGILEKEPSVWDWIGESLKEEEKISKEAPRIGADPKLFSKKHWEVGARNAAMTKANVTLVAVNEDLVDQIWMPATNGGDRPVRPADADIDIQTLKYAGVSWEEKVTHIRSEMVKVGAETILILDLMEIAWLLNLRGRIDIPYNPVFYAFLILPRAANQPLRLFVGARRTTEEIKKHLKPNCDGQKFEYYVDHEAIKREFCPTTDVAIEEYASFYEEVEKLVNLNDDTKFWLSGDANYKVFTTIPTSQQILDPPTPMRLLKAIKNPTEHRGMIDAHIKDAVALISFVADLEKCVADGGARITEVDVANDLKEFRCKEVASRGESFPTISGYKANGAIIHYDPSKNAEPAVIGAGMLLVDSGGQYLDGTTDVTRMFHYGMPTAYEKESYTRVLMGQVDLAMAIFPEGVMTGNGLQTLARSPLWRRGMEYHHGTGHGIGSFLSIHEWPFLGNDEPMIEGFFFSGWLC